MAFASAWLREKALFPVFIRDAPLAGTGIIITVPAYNEPQITKMLDSLALCTKPRCETEVIIGINAPVNAPAEHKEGNRQSLESIKSWKKQNKNCFFQLFCFEPESVIEGWGVGLARKTIMDEALRRFDALNQPGGVIVCLDADCTVKADYLTAIHDELFVRQDRNACSIYFEHPLSGKDYSEAHYRSIVQYELHLRYYYQGLVRSGFPYAFQTTGSAMAVKALTYMKSGGMNRKQAGEDFYFIQKVVLSGGYFYLNSTAVYPSPRTSYRVPFGTGASMGKLTKEEKQIFHTYNMKAFYELRTFFSMLTIFFQNSSNPGKSYDSLPEGIRQFIREDEWNEKIIEISGNTNGFSSFSKRFFAWFNMFKVVKYLNFIHQDIFSKIPVEQAASELLLDTGLDCTPGDPAGLLALYRSLERGYQ